jgi:hypothetical protein
MKIICNRKTQQLICTICKLRRKNYATLYTINVMQSNVMMHVVMLRVMAPSKRPTLKCENNCFRKSENSFFAKTSHFNTFNSSHFKRGSLNEGGRLSTVDLLILISILINLDELIFVLKILFIFLQNKLP